MRSNLQAILLALVFLATSLTLSQTTQSSMPNMPGMQSQTSLSDNTSMNMMKPPSNLIDAILTHTTSGTSAEPPSTPVSMLMSSYRGWTLMLHGTAFISDTQQQAEANPAGPTRAVCAQFNLPCSIPERRGGDKLFSTNWIMPMATRQLGPDGRYGQLTLRTMLSLEPATITGRQFP